MDSRYENGFDHLNAHLSTRSYISGFTPSHADVITLDQLFNCTRVPHLARWLQHVLSFTPDQRSAWPRSTDTIPCFFYPSPNTAVHAVEEKTEETEIYVNFDEDEEDADHEAAVQALIAKKQKEREDAKKAKEATKDTSKMAKSTLVLDIKPNDDETNLTELEATIRTITKPGLYWGACERKPIAFGLEKIRIMATIVDDLVGVVDLQDEIEDLDEVQSTDVFAFNKL